MADKEQTVSIGKMKEQVRSRKSILQTINEHKSNALVKMHKKELSDHSQKGRLIPTIFDKVKNK